MAQTRAVVYHAGRRGENQPWRWALWTQHPRRPGLACVAESDGGFVMPEQAIRDYELARMPGWPNSERIS